MCIGEQRREAVSQQSDRRRVGIHFNRNLSSSSLRAAARSSNSKQTGRPPYVPLSLRCGDPKRSKTLSISICPLTSRPKSPFCDGRTQITTCVYYFYLVLPPLNHASSIVTPVRLQGLISKFAVGAGRTSVDRQFFFVNGRPYNPGKVSSYDAVEYIVPNTWHCRSRKPSMRYTGRSTPTNLPL